MEGTPVKYLILIHSNPESRKIWEGFSDAERAEGFAVYAALNDDLAASGELIVSEALADPSLATRLPALEGWSLTGDVPLAEVKEHLAGFFLIDCENTERAIEIASRVPEAGLGLVEVRPIHRGDPLGKLGRRWHPELRHVLYLVFNEGYTASSGSALHRVELTTEAIRLTRQLRDRLPYEGEVAGLLALMLLTDARRPARTSADGTLVPLAEQDRSLWDAGAIAEGVTMITEALASAPIGPYQLQAAIAAVHDEAARYEDTDWREILGLYTLLDRIAPGPMVTLNRIVAIAMVHGPRRGLEQLAAAESDPALAGSHRVHAVRAHLLESAGDKEAARSQYQLAARRTLSVPEQRYLESRAARLAPMGRSGNGRPTA
jgi:hypothetical protein